MRSLTSFFTKDSNLYYNIYIFDPLVKNNLYNFFEKKSLFII